MPTISLIFATIAAIFHVLFFLMESVFWMNPKVHKTFGMKNIDEAAQFKLSFFNQGFYNLFLAIGCCYCMLAASIVLFISKPGMLRGVFIQGLCPLVAIVCNLFCR